MEINKKIYLKLVGVLFILFSLYSYSVNLYYGRWYELAWMCYFGLFLVGIGMLLENGFLILTQLNILFIVDIFWNIDFWFHAVTGRTLLGIINYYVLERNILFKAISIQHVFFVPFSLVALYYLKLARFDAWKVSLMQVAVVFPITYLFTPMKENVNCVFRECVNIGMGVPYFFKWLACLMIIIIITNLVIYYSGIFREVRKNQNFSNKKLKIPS